MRILFDQGTPVPLRQYLTDHVVETVYEREWSNLSNGELLNLVEQVGYEVIITTDQNLRYQQNLTNRRFAVIVLLSISWPRIQMRLDDIKAAIDDIALGDYIEIPI